MNRRISGRIRHANPSDYQSDWRQLIDGMQFSSQEFYAKLETSIERRQMPGLQLSRVSWKEGGALSAGREYLRICRQRLTFEICAAPFGSGFFVSVWYREKRLRLGLLSLIAFIATLAAMLEWKFYVGSGLGNFVYDNFGLNQDQAISLFCEIAVAAVVIMIIRAGANLDDLLINTPVVGFFYEKFFRTITLYRIDLTCMYLAAVHQSVVEVVDEICKVQGIKPLSEHDRRPIFRELL